MIVNETENGNTKRSRLVLHLTGISLREKKKKKSMLCALQRRLRSVQGESSCFPSRPRLFVVKTWNVAAPSAGRTVEVVLTYFHGNLFACVMLGAPLVAPGNRL